MKLTTFVVFVASLDLEMVDQLECSGTKIVMNGPIVRQLCVWEDLNDWR